MAGRLSPTRVAVALAAAGALAAGCSAGHPSAQTTPSTPSTTTSSSIPGATTSTAGGPPRCPASSLVLSVAGTQGAAGTFELTLQLRNTSSTTCTLQGYPGAQLYDAKNMALPTNVVRGGSYSFTDFAPSLVTMAAGASAYLNMAYSDVPTGSEQCPTAASMWVTPPDDVDHLVLTQQFVVCNGGRLTVSPVFGQGSPETHTTAPPQP